MGLSTQELLTMDFWQYNAYSQAWEVRTRDQLAITIQGAWMAAYWSGPSKHKKTLKSVLKAITRGDELPRERIDKKSAEKTFKQFEEILEHGWTKV